MRKSTQKSSDSFPSNPISIDSQYIKDLSYENLNNLYAKEKSDIAPDIDVSIELKVENINEAKFEIILAINVEARHEGKKIFIVELQYVGNFTFKPGIPDKALHAMVFIECPRLLFPFARSIIANVTGSAGHPALMLEPIDFVLMYQEQSQQQ